MKIEINEQKILTEILEMDGSLHNAIKSEVKQRLINKIVDEIEEKYLESSWRGRTDNIADSVTRDLEEKQTELVKKILKDFYNSYRYKKDNLQILKKLKEFIGEN